MPYSRAETSLLFCAGILFLLFASLSLHNLNPDGIAYIQVARYWRQLDFAYAVNGYWGPAFSWLILPFNVTGRPVLGANLAMAISGFGFMVASRSWFMATQLSITGRVLGLLMTSGVACMAIATAITPDLMMSAFIILAASMLSRNDWPSNRWRQAAAGTLLGLAYLTKAIALPFAILCVPAYALARWQAGDAPIRRWFLPVCTTLGMALLVATPWIATLSNTYGKFTFSTSGAINHAIVGSGQNNTHPYDTTFQSVPPGRVTNWEDPSREPYPFWSPFDSAEAFTHQVSIIRKNSFDMVDAISGLDPLRLGLVGLILSAMTMVFKRAKSTPQQSVAVCASASLLILYLPVFSGQVRYFLLLTPFLAAAALDLSSKLDPSFGFGFRRGGLGMASILVASTALISTLGVSAKTIITGTSQTRDYAIAEAIVARLKSEGLPKGGFAAVGKYPRIALDAAFLDRTHFNGREDQLGSNLTKLRETGAQYVIADDLDPATHIALERAGVRIFPDIPLVSVYRLNKP